MSYSNMKLYPEIKAEMQNVMEAEANAAAWKREAAARMKPVNILIRTAAQLNPSIQIDRKELLSEIRADLTPESPAEDDTAEVEETEAEAEETEAETPDENEAEG